MTAPVYRRVLGSDFETLPARVRDLHDLNGMAIWCGRADVERGTSILVRLLAPLFKLPPCGLDQPLRVTFTPSGDTEIWERAFAGRRFVSRQSARGDLIHETVGPVALLMRPIATAQGLSLAMVGARLFRLPLPRSLVPEIVTREYEAEGRYRFEVSATLPLFGLLVSYAGWLEKKG